MISELKLGATRALYIRTHESEAYVYYLIGEGKAPSADSGVYYTKVVMDANGKWHVDGETMRVKTQRYCGMVLAVRRQRGMTEYYILSNY